MNQAWRDYWEWLRLEYDFEYAYFCLHIGIKLKTEQY